MIYALLAVLLLVIAVLSLLLWMTLQKLVEVQLNAADERKTLEDRLMALTEPRALTQVKAMQEPLPGEIRYVDEEPGTDTIQRGRVEYAEA